MKKTVLLCISINHGIAKLIEENLKFHHFNVILLSPYNEKDEKFIYPSFLSKIKVKFKQLFFRDKQAKLKLQSEILRKNLTKKLGESQVDYSLFFLAQNYSVELIEFIKTKTKRNGMINYQWDGMDRYPLIYDRLALFDKAYVFDPRDLNNTRYPNLLPTTSFYFDYDLEKLSVESDFYFLGSHIPNRSSLIVKFANFAKNIGYKLNFQIFCGNKIEKVRHIYPENIQLLSQSMIKTYDENLMASRKAKILVDFVDAVHNGLSLRTFEALGHDKKLITTNKEIIKYDFYHPNNIFILDDNFDEIPDFLEKPYQAIDQKIKEKYSFGNWINYILDIHPHQPILLPLDNHEENKTIS